MGWKPAADGSELVEAIALFEITQNHSKITSPASPKSLSKIDHFSISSKKVERKQKSKQ